MAVDSTIIRYDLPYKNLVLTGFLGVGKSTIGRYLANKLAVDLFDLDDKIEIQETMAIAKIRELYGDTRLRALEHEMCRQAALLRREIIVVPGAALLDQRNYDLLAPSGVVVVLTCEIGEALRRMHMARAVRFRDEGLRKRMIGRLRREYEVVNDERFLQLDTTHLTIEEESELLLSLWLTGKPESELFRQGPAPPLKPPPRPPLGLSVDDQAKRRFPRPRQ